MSHKIFVYGTLKRGQPNHYLALEPPGSCKYIGRAVTVHSWPLVVAGPFNIPYVLDVKGAGKPFYGEVFELDDVKLEIFDALESHPDRYTRTPIQVKLVTDADDKPKEGKLHLETIEVYLLQRPRKYLLDLPMIDNYISGSAECPAYVLPQDRTSTGPSWGPADLKETH